MLTSRTVKSDFTFLFPVFFTLQLYGKKFLLIIKASIFTVKSFLMVILLTGASRGIGAALAGQFTRAGHKVLLVSRNRTALDRVAEECNQKAGDVLAYSIPFDLSDLGDLNKELISRIETHTDRIDALFNNAGQLIRKPFESISIEEARVLFDINLIIPGQLIRICLPYLSDSPLKHVVNVSSMGGFQGSGKFPGLSYYSASKAALASLTECLAEEFKEKGIRVNALAIGAVQTEMLAEAFPGYKAPLEPDQMAEFMKWFTLEGGKFFNGKILPVSVATP
jgi:NAD(P)-dependent dehydrogenase (short-subunit alcohol dehydrogenase family)